MIVFGFITLLCASTVILAASPLSNTDVLQLGPSSNVSVLTASAIPRPACYSRLRLDKPKLNQRSCQMVWNWWVLQEEAGKIVQKHEWVQPNDNTGHLVPPENREYYVGCVISVYSRTPGARARFSYESILQAADRIESTCASGRGGKTQIYDTPVSAIPGWFVKLESWEKR